MSTLHLSYTWSLCLRQIAWETSLAPSLPYWSQFPALPLLVKGYLTSLLKDPSPVQCWILASPFSSNLSAESVAFPCFSSLCPWSYSHAFVFLLALHFPRFCILQHCHWPSFLACPYRLPTWLQLPSPSCHSHSAVCKNHRFHCNCNRSLCIFPHIMEGSWVACALFPVGISCPCDQRSLYLILSLQVNSPSLVTSLPSGVAALLPSWRLTTHSFFESL